MSGSFVSRRRWQQARVAAVYGSPPRRWHACATRYAIEDDPGAFHTTGWHGVYVSRHSLLAVAAESAADIVVAVDFAREHDTRLVIEGTRHDYLGRSCVSGALLIRTHRMREITVHDAFVPAGPPVGKPGVPAITVGAGT